jgi:hypothetical protein
VEDLKFALNHSFDEWIEKNYSSKWFDHMLGRGQRSLFNKYVDNANGIIRFEHLQEDFESTLKSIGIDESILIPSFNTTPARDKDYRKYYSNKSRKIVEYTFKKDLERFNYYF